MSSLVIPLCTNLIEEVRVLSQRMSVDHVDCNDTVVEKDLIAADLFGRFEAILRRRLTESVLTSHSFMIACYLDKGKQKFLNDEQTKVVEEKLLSESQRRFREGEFCLSAYDLSRFDVNSGLVNRQNFPAVTPNFIAQNINSVLPNNSFAAGGQSTAVSLDAVSNRTMSPSEIRDCIK